MKHHFAGEMSLAQGTGLGWQHHPIFERWLSKAEAMYQKDGFCIFMYVILCTGNVVTCPLG